MKNIENLRSDNFFEIDVDKKLMPVIVASSTEFYKPFYELSLIQFPMNAEFNFVHVGKSSIAIRLSLYSGAVYSHSNLPLMNMTLYSAIINMQTRKSADIPEQKLQEIKKLCVHEVPITKVTVPQKPHKICHMSVMKMAASDMDHLQHVNNSVLYRSALNAVEAAAAAGSLGKDHSNSDFQLAKIDVINLKEVFAGDILHAHVWLLDRNLVGCQLERNSSSVFRCAMQFF